MKYLILLFFVSCMKSTITSNGQNLGQNPVGSETTTTTSTTTTTTPINSGSINRNNGDADLGETIYASQSCIACHGVDGRSGTFGIDITASSDDEIYTTVTQGSGDMPSYPNLEDSDIENIAAFIGSLE